VQGTAFVFQILKHVVVVGTVSLEILNSGVSANVLAVNGSFTAEVQCGLPFV
jgi:hypothetical protein